MFYDARCTINLIGVTGAHTAASCDSREPHACVRCEPAAHSEHLKPRLVFGSLHCESRALRDTCLTHRCSNARCASIEIAPTMTNYEYYVACVDKRNLHVQLQVPSLRLLVEMRLVALWLGYFVAVQHCVARARACCERSTSIRHRLCCCCCCCWWCRCCATLDDETTPRRLSRARSCFSAVFSSLRLLLLLFLSCSVSVTVVVIASAAHFRRRHELVARSQLVDDVKLMIDHYVDYDYFS